VARVRQRYAARPAIAQRGGIVVVLVILAALVVWTAWAFWVHVHPKVASSLSTWTPIGQTRMKVTADVTIYDHSVLPTCTVLVYASDHSTVGEAVFHPIDGTQTITVQTVRLGTSVDWIGCTAPGQKDPE
jgi:hypothetical protein